MSLLPLTIPPGVYRTGTAYQSMGRWYESDLIRWFAKAMGPFGGWRKVTDTVLDGPGRGIVTWRPSTTTRYAGIGTPDSLYIWNDDVITDITPAGFPSGSQGSMYGIGYGSGLYGVGVYGQTTGSDPTDATTWSLDSWGDYLVACASHDRVLYEWTGNLANPAVAVTGAPSMRAFVVTAERVILALGADGDDRAVDWCDIGANTVWTPTASNAAGGVELQTNGVLMTGRRVPKGTLLWTTTDVWLATYVGQPDIYVFDQKERGCGLLAPQAVQVTPGGTFWMGIRNFFRYDGRVVPLPCDVQDYVFQDINFDQAAQFSSGHNAAFGEVYWWYCSAGSDTLDRCVSYNYRENHWAMHPSLIRSCWEDASTFRYPLAVSPAGVLYEQESGWTADGTPILDGRYAKSGPVEFGAGDRIMEAKQLVPDTNTEGDAQVRFESRFTPDGDATAWGPYPIAAYTDTRVTGRQLSVILEATADRDWRLGVMRLEAEPGGGR